MKGTNRKTDSKTEALISEFLCKYLYDQLENDFENFSYRQIKDESQQRKGIDVLLKWEGDSTREIKVDEKATIYYFNKMIPTFAFEIDSIQTDEGDCYPGWFINDELLTEWYHLIWPNAKPNWKSKNQAFDLNHLELNDITICETILISKKVLKNNVKSDFCLSSNDELNAFLLEQSKKIREGIPLSIAAEKTIEKETFTKIKINDNYSFHYSKAITERPVNLVISKNKLLEWAGHVYLVCPDGYGTIK